MAETILYYCWPSSHWLFLDKSPSVSSSPPRLRAGRDGSQTTDYRYQPGADCHLDQANGCRAAVHCSTQQPSRFTFPGGQYGYVFTTSYPFIMPGYRGAGGTATLCAL